METTFYCPIFDLIREIALLADSLTKQLKPQKFKEFTTSPCQKFTKYIIPVSDLEIHNYQNKQCFMHVQIGTLTNINLEVNHYIYRES